MTKTRSSRQLGISAIGGRRKTSMAGELTAEKYVAMMLVLHIVSCKANFSQAKKWVDYSPHSCCCWGCDTFGAQLVDPCSQVRSQTEDELEELPKHRPCLAHETQTNGQAFEGRVPWVFGHHVQANQERRYGTRIIEHGTSFGKYR